MLGKYTARSLPVLVDVHGSQRPLLPADPGNLLHERQVDESSAGHLDMRRIGDDVSTFDDKQFLVVADHLALRRLDLAWRLLAG